MKLQRWCSGVFVSMLLALSLFPMASQAITSTSGYVWPADSDWIYGGFGQPFPWGADGPTPVEYAWGMQCPSSSITDPGCVAYLFGLASQNWPAFTSTGGTANGGGDAFLFYGYTSSLVAVASPPSGSASSPPAIILTLDGITPADAAAWFSWGFSGVLICYLIAWAGAQILDAIKND